VTGLNVVSKRTATGRRWYVYAWRGGPCIHVVDGEAKPVIGPELLGKAMAARKEQAGQRVDGFEQIITDYEASPEFTRLAESTKRDYRLWLTRISAKWGKAPIEAFTDQRMRREIILWRDTWAHQPRTADKASVMMATLLGWAMENGILPVNVAARIRQLHQVNKADQVWEPRHWQALADHWQAEQLDRAHLLDALKLAGLTGLRLGDLVRLSWDQVGEKAIILTTRKRKGRAVIPILPELRQLLDARDHRKGTILQTTRGTSWTESGLGTVFQRSKPAGFDRTIHDLRGTYVTWLATRRLTDDEIARIVGWTARRVAEIRARYVDEATVVTSLVDRLSA
jgi:integrase